MSLFTIEKSTTGNFWHKYGNGSNEVSISDFQVVIDAVKRTFIIQPKNGSNIPSQAVSFNDLRVVDLNVSTTPIPFTTGDSLIEILKGLNYTPYIVSSGSTTPVKVWTKGDTIFLNRPQQFFNDNFDNTGLGILEMVGWKKSTIMAGRVPVGQGTSPLNNLGTQGGFRNTVLVSHKHKSAVLSDGDAGVNTLGTGPTVDGYVLVEAEANQKIVETSTVGQDQDGNPSTTENGVNKNFQPYTVVFWVERTEDLWINGVGGSSTTPNLTQVLTQGDISTYTVPIPNNTFLTFDLGRQLTINNFTTDDVGTGGVFLDKDVIMPENATIIFQAGYVEDSVTPTDVTLLPYRFTTDAYVFYQGARVTDITIQPEDVCTLKWGGNNSTDGIQIWFLTIVSKSSGGSVDPADLISTDADNVLVLGTDNKLFVPESVAPTGNKLEYCSSSMYDGSDPTIPIVTELINDIGEIIVSFNDTDGKIVFTSDNLFTNTNAIFQNILQPVGDPLETCYIESFSDSVISIQLLNNSLGVNPAWFIGGFPFRMKLEKYPTP